jgi:hypothetical protein
MGRILDLVPPLYRQEGNELAGFLSKLEPELDALEKKTGDITSLVDVDKCPEEYLPYLAALTNAPLLGDNPLLWRRQIRNWPWLLKIKGTEKSLAVFLQSVGVKSYTLHTWFRNSSGNLVEGKPTGEPFFDAGKWHNARTHYFSVDMVFDKELVTLDSYSQKDLLEKVKQWMERTKPFHAELLNLIVIPDIPGLDPSTHGCRYDYCQYGHGFLPGLELSPGAMENPREPEITSALIITTSEYFKYPLWISWSGTRYGDILPETGQRSASTIITFSYSDREAMEGYNTWRRRERWDDKSWPESKERTGCVSFLQVFPIGCAVYGYARYDNWQAVESRYWYIPEPYRYDGSILDSSQDAAKFLPIDEYSVIDNGGEVVAIVTAEAVSGEFLYLAVAHENESGAIEGNIFISGTVFENEIQAVGGGIVAFDAVFENEISVISGEIHSFGAVFENEIQTVGGGIIAFDAVFENEISAVSCELLCLAVAHENESEAIEGKIFISGAVFENEPQTSRSYTLTAGENASVWANIPASWDSDTWRLDRTWVSKPPAIKAENNLIITEVS